MQGLAPKAVRPTEELHRWMPGVAWWSPSLVVGTAPRGEMAQFTFPLRAHLSLVSHVVGGRRLRCREGRGKWGGQLAVGYSGSQESRFSMA